MRAARCPFCELLISFFPGLFAVKRSHGPLSPALVNTTAQTPSLNRRLRLLMPGCESASGTFLKSGRGLPQSKTLRDGQRTQEFCQVLDCASHLALWRPTAERRTKPEKLGTDPRPAPDPRPPSLTGYPSRAHSARAESRKDREFDMRWLRIVVGGGCVLATALTLHLGPRAQPEPEFGGKIITQWLDAGQDDVCLALHEIGPPALPFVLAKFAREDPKQGSAIRYRQIWLRVPPRARGLLPQPAAVNFDETRACTALLELGPGSIPALAGALEHRNPMVRSLSAHALGLWRERGKDIGRALPALAKAMQDPNPAVRLRAAEALKMNHAKSR